MKFQLFHNKPLQGQFELAGLNLVFVFQVNCPGCFFYGIPQANKLFHAFRDSGLQVLGLSTAFEDVGFNTERHTRWLLERGETVGATRDALLAQGYKHYPQPIDFPVAMDRTVNSASDLTPAQIDHVCSQHPDFRIWPAFEQDAMRQKVTAYFDRKDVISLTFSLNNMRGTPSFFLVNRDLDIRATWFGHQSDEAVTNTINTWLNNP